MPMSRWARPSPQRPDWKAVHDYHDAARRQAQEEQLRLGEAGDYASGAYAEADRRCKHHLAASLATFEIGMKVSDYFIQSRRGWVPA